MSTFDGFVREFPDIQIDYFRPSNEQSRPPLAFFLSHVHSDHLTGLETCKSPFIYCSPATREILLRLEKYPHRMNFAKGILETRVQTFRHLKNLLKPIPLETPAVLELSPGRSIRVTLFDANHCVGAVMFLIEGEGNAILYTGDIRSEAWWVDSLARHPLLLPYAAVGEEVPLKRLDNIYLDTTFASKEDKYRRFPTKREGLTELLLKLSAYPKDTRFYFDSWTFGYEDVWQTLSSFLDSQVHLDEYRLGLYRSLANGVEPKAGEVAKLMGFHCGNHFQQGCLSGSQTRVHSCEKGAGCEIWSQDFVRITPIISRHGGQDMSELGAGGGQGDFDQQHELEVGDVALLGQLISLCASSIQDQPDIRAEVLQMLTSVINGQVQSIPLDASAFLEYRLQTELGVNVNDLDELPLDRLVTALTKGVAKEKHGLRPQSDQTSRGGALKSSHGHGPPKQITFPYSRHSSYGELCLLIEVFKPKDIYPCTVDKTNWTPDSSMAFLFGHFYPSNKTFTHDQKMMKNPRTTGEDSTQRSRFPPQISHRKEHDKGDGDRSTRYNPPQSRDRTGSRQPQRDNWPPTTLDHYSPTPRKRKSRGAQPSPEIDKDRSRRRFSTAEATSMTPQPSRSVTAQSDHHARFMAAAFHRHIVDDAVAPDHRYETGRLLYHDVETKERAPCSKTYPEYHADLTDLRHLSPSLAVPSLSPATQLAMRQEAHDAALGLDEMLWSDIISLVSTGGHQVKEEEL